MRRLLEPIYYVPNFESNVELVNYYGGYTGIFIFDQNFEYFSTVPEINRTFSNHLIFYYYENFDSFNRDYQRIKKYASVEDLSRWSFDPSIGFLRSKIISVNSKRTNMKFDLFCFIASLLNNTLIFAKFLSSLYLDGSYVGVQFKPYVSNKISENIDFFLSNKRIKDLKSIDIRKFNMRLFGMSIKGDLIFSFRREFLTNGKIVNTIIMVNSSYEYDILGIPKFMDCYSIKFNIDNYLRALFQLEMNKKLNIIKEFYIPVLYQYLEIEKEKEELKQALVTRRW